MGAPFRHTGKAAVCLPVAEFPPSAFATPVFVVLELGSESAISVAYVVAL